MNFLKIINEFLTYDELYEVAKFIVVVVFPTPPFWLDIEIIFFTVFYICLFLTHTHHPHFDLDKDRIQS